MKTCWWQDNIDDYQQWHSLFVRVNAPQGYFATDGRNSVIVNQINLL
ncbi:hypothetical protein AB7160_15200 [Morganella morganii]